MNRPKPNSFSKTFLINFFCWCSGAELDLLKEIPSEKQKYVTIGLLLLIISVSSFWAIFYVFYLVLDVLYISYLFGLLWSIIVFVLLRYLITPIKSFSSFSKNYLYSTPALLLSILISISISTSLDIKIFDRDIETKYKSNPNIFEQLNIDNKIKVLNADNTDINSLIKEEYYKTNLVAREPYLKKKRDNDSLIYLLSKRSNYLAKNINAAKSANLTFFEMYQMLNIIKDENIEVLFFTSFVLFTILIISFFPIIIKLTHDVSPYDELKEIRDKALLTQINLVGDKSEADEEKVLSQIEDLKNRFDDLSISNIKNSITELLNKPNDSQSVNYEVHFNRMISMFADEIKRIEKNARDFFWQGIVFSLIGIIIAFGLLIFWLNYFAVNKFQIYHIFELVSGTVIILLVEFLGAWFLKQYRMVSEKATQVLKSKSILDRYMLSYLAINEYASVSTRENYLEQLLTIIDKDLKFPVETNSSQDTSFAQEALSSITNLTDIIKNMNKVK